MDIIQGKLGRGPNNRSGIVQLRVPTNAQSITHLAVSIALPTYRMTIAKYCPDKEPEYRTWYTTEIRETYMRLSESQLINVKTPGV
jgi:Leu/Phe-tRNA-protein transferase